MNFLSKLAKSASQYKLATTLFVLAILAMVVLPLPAPVLDVFFTFNIVLALVIVMVSVSAKRPLDFSVFPTIILATTLLRLTLNVASTRVVLLHGHEGTHAAGRVIESFGNVVIGGNFVVGLVVFVILMIINFVVITKGAERISEVSARFTLDALPGKQMAIDADLNAGLINQEKAQSRRREIGLEADFYGAMDGASKFVRGDAVAGILILLINLIGGVAIGAFMYDLSFADSFRQYALLTIGDGLVAQIPALLLSSAAAIIITRVSDSDDFERQVGAQLLAQPSILYSAAALLGALGLIPGMPWLPFLSFAAVLCFAGWRLSQRKVEAPAATASVEAALLAESPPELDWKSLPAVDRLSVYVGYKLVSTIDPAKGAALTKRIRGVRQTMSEAMGVLLPHIGVRDDLTLKPSTYSIHLGGTPLASAEVHADKLMAIPSAQVYGDLNGIPGVEPAYGLPVMWIAPEEKAHALGLGYQVVDVPSAIATHVAKLLRENLPDILTHEDMPALLERLALQAPKLSAALEKAMTHTQLLKVFRALLTENVSLKDIVPIATALLDASETTKDPVLLAAEVRCTVRRQIVHAIAGAVPVIKAFSLTNEFENLLLGALAQAQQRSKVPLDGFNVDPTLLSKLQVEMPSVREALKQQGAAPILVVPPQLRPILARYAKVFAAGLNVLSYNEVPENREVSVIGTLG